MARLVLLVLGVINFSFAYWLPWKSSNVEVSGVDTETVPSGCGNQLMDVQCRVKFTKQPITEIMSSLQFRPNYECTLENGLWCTRGPGGGPCPDFEIRFWCNDSSGQPILHRTLANGPRVSEPDLITPEEYCQSQTPSPSDYHVVENSGTFSLVSAPDVLNYACTISTGSGAYIDLGDHPNSCISDPSRCFDGRSTWSIWLKINHADNVGQVTYMSSGMDGSTGVFFSQSDVSQFKYGASIGAAYWVETVPSGIIPDGSWFHLAMWIDASAQKLGAYINGEVVGSAEIAATARSTTVMPSAVRSLTLGTLSGQKGQQLANAAYSDFRIFEKKLDIDVIERLHDCGVHISSQVVSIWNIQQMEAENPNELRYHCIRRTKDALEYHGFVWKLFSVDGGLTELKRESPNRDSACFFKSELVIDKYTDLGHEGYEGQTFVVCEVGPDYESLEITEDLTYEWTPWLSSSEPRDSAVGDNETLLHVREAFSDVCTYPVKIECRERYTMKSYEYLRDKGDVVATGCDVSEGLLCLHEDQSDGSCPDFEVRFLCAGDTGSVEIESMFITRLSDDILQAECKIEYSTDYALSWSWYDSSTDDYTNVTNGPGVNITSSSDAGNNLLSSVLTVADPSSKNLMGRYVVCRVLSSLSGVELAYDSLQVDNVFQGTVTISPSALSPVAYGSSLTLECAAEDDTVHSMEWYRAPLHNPFFYIPLNPVERYARSAYYGGQSQLQIANFQSEDSGYYLCVVNWWSAKANVTLQGPLPTTTVPPITSQPTTPSPTTTQPPTTSQPTTPSPTTTQPPTTSQPTTPSPTTPQPPTTSQPTTPSPTTGLPTLQSSTAYATSSSQSTTAGGMTSSSTLTTEQVTVAGGTTASASGMTSLATPEPTAGGTSTSQTGGPTAVPLSTSTEMQTTAAETPFVSDATSASVTPTWCAVSSIVDLQTAVACGDASGIDVDPGELTEAKREELVNVLKFILSQPTEQLAKELTTFSETAAVTKVVLMVFSKLTDPDQNLSIQNQTEILADTEEALKALAGTFLPRTCASIGYEDSSVSLCHVPSLGLLSGSTFTHEVPLTHNATGDVIPTFEEKLEFDLSDLDLSAENVAVVYLRKQKPVHTVNNVKYLEPTGDIQAPYETWVQSNSALIKFSLFVEYNRTSVPVTFSLYHLKDVKNESTVGDSATVNTFRTSICAFLDDEHGQDTQWSVYGCEVVWDRSSSKYSYCTCNHSTNFAVLMQVKSFEISHADSLTLTWITKIGCGISMLMLVLTLVVYFYLGRMLQFDRAFIHTNLSIAILVAQILFIAGIERTKNRGVCKAVALLLHFCYLSVFAWMLVEGVHLYMKVVKVYGSENIKMYPYLLIGWGIPAIITLVSFGTGIDGYGTHTSCWLDTSSGTIWAFVAPALLVVMINTIVLALVVRIVIRSAHVHREKKYDHIRAGIKGAAMLLPILGLTWVFGLLAVNSATIVFQYLFTIFNSFQGLFIFLINCAINSEVRAAFARNREKQKAASEKRTSDHSLALVHLKRTNSSETENTRNGGCCSDDVGAKEHTDITSVSSARPTSSEPENGTSPCDVKQRTHLKRPHSGKVMPMSVDDIEGVECPEFEKV